MKQEWKTAIDKGDLQKVRELIAAGININSLDRHGQTALMRAALHGQSEIVGILVDSGAELNHTAKFGLSALMLAVINDHPEIVETLVRAGADTKLRGSSRSFVYNRTAIELAEQLANKKCYEILIKQNE